MLFLILHIITLYSQGPDPLWIRTYGGLDWDYGCQIRQTSDSGYIIIGETYSYGAGECDVYLIKINSNGDTLWTKTYGGNDCDAGYSVQQTFDEGYIIVGSTASFGSGNHDVYLIKTDPNGYILWTKTYGGEFYDGGYFIKLTSDGGYIILGSTYSFGAGFSDVYLIKTDSNGDTIWTKTYGGLNDDFGSEVQKTFNNGYIITGTTYSYGAGDADLYLIRIDSLGDTIWTKTYGGIGFDRGISIQVTSDSGFIVTGCTDSFGEGWSDVYLIKTDMEGDTMWTRTYGGLWNELGVSIRNTLDDNFIITGATSSFGAGFDDIYLLKVDTNGNPVWDCAYGESEQDLGSEVLQTPDGGYIIVGLTTDDTYDQDVILIKTNPVKLVSPDGSDTLEQGDNEIIMWWCENPMKNSYRLLLSIDGGYTYLDTIAQNISSDSTSWNWIVPNVNSIRCRVNVQVLDHEENVICEDVSNSNFAIGDVIPPIPFKLIYPPDSIAISITKPILIWEASLDLLSGLKDYKIYINDTLRGTVIDTFWTVDFALSDFHNDWFTVAYDSAGNSQQSEEIWTFFIDTLPPQISNTTVWNEMWDDSILIGPFEVYSTITDNFGVRKAELWYKTNIDKNWINLEMDTTEGANRYLGEIPPQIVNTKVFYYIRAEDLATPPNVAKDPFNAPDSTYSFTVVYGPGIMEEETVPKAYILSQNYPNPFILNTTIKFGIPKKTYVDISIYNLSGQLVYTLLSEEKKAGYYEVVWYGKNDKGLELPSSIYLYRLETEYSCITRKMLILR